MAKTFTLDAFREAVESKYASTNIDLGAGDIISLRNPLRMGDKERDELTALAESQEVEEEGKEADVEEQRQNLVKMIELFVGDKKASDRLLATNLLDTMPLRSDMAGLAFLVEQHMSGVQVGEASASQG